LFIGGASNDRYCQKQADFKIVRPVGK